MPEQPSEQPRRSVSYADAGVDIDAADATARRFGAIGRGTHGPEVLRMGGGFAGLFALGEKGYRDPVLVGATDGVGTKVLIAATLGQFEGTGRDVVNNNVNDLITVGAEPLFFLDYLATADLPQEQRVEIVAGIGAACEAQGIALLGGETADMPDIYRSGDFDLAGFIVGVVERDRIIDGSRLADGDALVALPSSGLQTNGYSLVREIWGLGKGMRDESPAARAAREGVERLVLESRPEELGGQTLGEALLKVHESFYPALKPLMPTPMLNVRNISAGVTLPSAWINWNSGGTCHVLVSTCAASASGNGRPRLPGMPPPVMCASAFSVGMSGFSAG